MKWALLGLALLPALFLIGVESDEPPRQDTVDELDVDKYLGKWYAVAGIPQFFNKNRDGIYPGPSYSEAVYHSLDTLQFLEKISE